MDGILDIRSNEGRTLVIKIGWAATFDRNTGNIFHFYAQGLQGRFFQKRSGSGGAGFVHGIVGSYGIGDVSVLGVLPPDFKNGIHLGVKIYGGRGMGDDLIDDPVR